MITGEGITTNTELFVSYIMLQGKLDTLLGVGLDSEPYIFN